MTKGAVAALAAVLLVLWSFASPVSAGGHGRGGGGAPAAQGDRDGDADRDPETRDTEDNDHNDGGTPDDVEDEGDNAHPSGRDRSVEPGGSGNQGRAESDPDDDGRGPDRTNGGPDKPNGSGGDDLADQDGNNGCGNDDDFEDDNEGWCGRPRHAGPPADDDDDSPPRNPPRGDDDDDDDSPPRNPPRGGGGVQPTDDDGDSTPRTPPSDDDDNSAPPANPAGGGVQSSDDDDDRDRPRSSRDDTTGAAGGAEVDDDRCPVAGEMTDADDADCGEVLASGGEQLGAPRGAEVSPAVMSGTVSALSPATAAIADLPVAGSVAAGALAFTGDHILLLVGGAAGAIGIGAALSRRSRSARPA